MHAHKQTTVNVSRFTFHALRFTLFFVFALLNLWPLTACPNCTAFPPDSPYTDLLISHWPNTEYWREAIWQYGQWPLWNEQLFGGQPFAADPLAGLWYPPNWALLILPLPFGFNLLWVLHLAWAGLGLYHFLRAQNLPEASAILGGLVFSGTPKLMAHIGAGHLSLVFAVAWMPWVLFSLVSQSSSVSPRFQIRTSLTCGLCLALTFLADPRWAFYSGLLVVAFLISRRTGFKATFIQLSTLTFTALLLSAVLWLPLTEFVLQTNRSALTLSDAAEFSLPWLWLLGLLVAPLRGFHEYMTYVGLVPLLLALVGAARRQRFWLSVLLVSVLFALGDNFGLFPAVFKLLPGLSFLRVPSRVWFLVALALSVLAAHGLHHLLSLLEKNRTKVKPSFLFFPLLFFTVADLVRVNVTLVEAHPRPALNAASAWLASQPGFFRVYSPSYSLPLDDGLYHVDGVNPLQLKTVAQFMAQASGVPLERYSVTVPSFSGDVTTANANAVPSARLLGLLSVKYVVAEFDVNSAGLWLAQTFGRTRIYENVQWEPRAWLAEGRAAEVLQATPNRVVVQASGPGTLILSDVNYIGWQATVDGASVSIETVENLLRGVQLAEGAHTVVFEFWPLSVFVGLAISLLSLAGVIWLWLRP